MKSDKVRGPHLQIELHFVSVLYRLIDIWLVQRTAHVSTMIDSDIITRLLLLTIVTAPETSIFVNGI